MSLRDEDGKVKGWSFAIVGSDARHVTKFLGFQDQYEEALKFGNNMAHIGWRNVRIYDVNLRLVKEKP